MKNMDIKYEKRYERIVKDQLLELFKDTTAIIFLFGSRARGDYKQGSDFDIGFESVEYNIFRALKIKFDDFWEDSIVPYKVDLVFFDHVDAGFKQIAKKDVVIWKAG